MMNGLTLIIGNKNYSSWSLRPWVFMKTFGIEFEEKRIALFTEKTDEELSPYFSNYKVPVLLDGDFIIWDSLSIMEYVSEKYLDSEGWPEDLNARAFARSVSAEMHSSFSELRSVMPMNCRKKFNNFNYSAAVEADVQRIKNIWRKCRSEYGANGEWLFGRYSIADAMFAPIVLRFHGYGVLLDESEQAYVNSVLGSPQILDWVKSGKEEKEVIAQDEVDI
jgi:glutathione S-transferase